MEMEIFIIDRNLNVNAWWRQARSFVPSFSLHACMCETGGGHTCQIGTMLIWVADRWGWGNVNSATQEVSCQPTFPCPTQTQSANNVAHQKGILIYSGLPDVWYCEDQKHITRKYMHPFVIKNISWVLNRTLWTSLSAILDGWNQAGPEEPLKNL